MTNANVMLALGELRREYAEVDAEVDRVQQNLAALQNRQERLSEAIDSLQRLNEPEEPEAEPQPESRSEPDTAQLLLNDGKDGPLVPPDCSPGYPRAWPWGIGFWRPVLVYWWGFWACRCRPQMAVCRYCTEPPALAPKTSQCHRGTGCWGAA